ncbi:FCD domain-containing protein [Nocardia mangyaensis]|uniref:FCD domain-containing protein n=1 Tax=Nocardia mangyaensis TaxID=2213200 RepID=UPI0026774C93|nr:FCD domain-containing protein [Nocardia mangyaensis]MDO3646188.1 FCD domain-containing protein [Nocardia mangyaensis]
MVAQHEQAVAEGADLDRIVALGHEFHRSINLAADSRRLALLPRSIVKQLPSRFYGNTEDHASEALDFHPAILEALRKRRAKTASNLMRDHIMSGADELIAMVEQQGMLDPSVRFGGTKMSGYGWKGGREHVESYLYPKAVYMNPG